MRENEVMVRFKLCRSLMKAHDHNYPMVGTLLKARVATCLLTFECSYSVQCVKQPAGTSLFEVAVSMALPEDDLRG